MPLRDQMGVCVGAYNLLPVTEFDRIAGAFSWVRVDAYWNGQDRNNDVYRFEQLNGFVREMAARDVSTLVILNYGNANYPQIGLNTSFTPPTTPEQLGVWERWVRRLADNLKGYPVAYEIWNEPYSDDWWGGKANAEEYAQLCRFTRDVLRDCAPGATIVSGGGLALFPHSTAQIDAVGAGYPTTIADMYTYPQLVDYAQDYLDAGGHVGFDALAMHPYRDYWAPEDLTEDEWFRQRTDIPLWFTEYGWTLGWTKRYEGNYPVGPVNTSTLPQNIYYTEEDKAKYLSRMFLFGAQRGIVKQFWYNYADLGGKDPYASSIDPLVDNTRYPVKYSRRHQGGGGYFMARREPNFGLVEENSSPYIEDWRVGDIAVTRPGVSYPQATVTFTGGGGGVTRQAVAKARMLDGGVHELILLDGGAGYTERPVMTITPSDGFGKGANFKAAMSDPIDSIMGFERKSRGFGYSTPKFVSSGGGPTAGSGAAITLTMSGGKVTGAAITNPGGGYVLPPYIRVSGGAGGGATLVAELGTDPGPDAGTVEQINIAAGGANYAQPPKITITGGGGADARATCIINAGGVITSVIMVNGGHDYTSVPTVTVTPYEVGPDVAQVVCTLKAGGMLDTVTVVKQGSGYTSTPIASVVTGGAGAKFRATEIVSGHVTKAAIVDPGSGYIAPPGVYSVGGFGNVRDVTGAIQYIPGTATPSIPPDVTVTRTGGAITALALGANEGSRFLPGPTATIDAGSVATATAIPIVVGGCVVAFHITSRGAGYVTAPTVSISRGYWMNNLGELIPSNGFGATATAVLGTGSDSDKVVDIIVTKGGAGYQPHPEVVFKGGGLNGTEPSTPAVAIAVVEQGNVNREIKALYLLSGGSGYVEDPDVEILPSETYDNVAFKTTIDANGIVTAIEVLNPDNQYYSDYPRLETVGGPGSAKGYCVVYDGKVESVEILQTGGGFARGATPTLSIINPGVGVGGVLRPVMRQRPRPLSRKPPYLAALTLFEELGGYEYKENLSTTSGVYQQVWTRPDGLKAWACWCTELKGTHTLTLPLTAKRIVNHIGGEVPVVANIVLTPNPVYIFLEG